MKRAFVTGATGFIGAAITRLLVRSGVPTAILLRNNSDPWRLGGCLDHVTVIRGEFQASTLYVDDLIKFGPDTVFHLAWDGVGREKRNDPSQVRINVPGTIDLFLASLRAGVQFFVAAGSQAEYGLMHQRADETHPTKPTSLYGAAKNATLGLLEHLATAHQAGLAWLRVFSIYGPQDDDDTLMSSLIRTLLEGARPAVTDGRQLWDYLYVDDAAEAFLSVAKSRSAGVFNVGYGQAAPLRTTMSTVRDLINPSLEIGFGDIPLGPTAITHLEPDVTKLTQATGWSPQVPVYEGLCQTIAWQRSRRTKENETNERADS